MTEDQDMVYVDIARRDFGLPVVVMIYDTKTKWGRCWVWERDKEPLVGCVISPTGLDFGHGSVGRGLKLAVPLGLKVVRCFYVTCPTRYRRHNFTVG
jgi:hypothetical protein